MLGATRPLYRTAPEKAAFWNVFAPFESQRDLLRRVAHCGSVDVPARRGRPLDARGRRETHGYELQQGTPVTPGKKVTLGKWDPEDTLGWKRGHKMTASLDKACEQLDQLQYLLYAEHKRALLVVLQGLDAAGKERRHPACDVRREPQGCTVTPFKKPSEEEMEHDFLWRIHKAVPEYGDIGIFNRSYYEDVLIVRVHNLVPKTSGRAAMIRSTNLKNSCRTTT